MSDLDYQCATCQVMFSSPLFDISRADEKVVETPGQEHECYVDIRRSMEVATFCSVACRDQGRAAVMTSEGVLMLSDRPGIEAVEKCAVCRGPVDTRQWHLTYTESDFIEPGESIVEDIDYLAVVCNECEAKI